GQLGRFSLAFLATVQIILEMITSRFRRSPSEHAAVPTKGWVYLMTFCLVCIFKCISLKSPACLPIYCTLSHLHGRERFCRVHTNFRLHLADIWLSCSLCEEMETCLDI